MQAIILAAGEGRRLRPLTVHRPKVMIPVSGRPILEHVVEALAANKVTDITIVTGYRRESIQTHFQDGDDWGVDIQYAAQLQQLGTGHALAAGFDATVPDKPFLVLPGDNFVTSDLLAELIKAPGESALVTTRSAQPSKYGVVHSDGGKVTRIEEKPATPATRIISTGIYRFAPAIREYVEGVEGVRLTDAVNRFINDGHSVTSVPTEDSWQDVVFPWDLLRVNHHVLHRLEGTQNQGTKEEGVVISGACRIGAGTTLRHGCYVIGPVHIGEDCDIGPNVVLRGPLAIGDHVRIGPFSDIEDAAIMDNVQIDTGAILRHTVVDEGARLGPRVSSDSGPAVFEIDDDFQRIDMLGAVIGQDALLGANVVLEPGSVIGTQASVAPNRTVQRVPDKGVVA